MARLAPTLLVLLLPACARPGAEAPKTVDTPTVSDTPPAEPAQPAAADAAPAAEESPPEAAPPPATSSRPIQITDTCEGRPVRVFTAAVDGNDLFVKFGTGGCDVPEIWACTDGKLMESLPPKLRIEIRRGDAGRCEKLHTFREHFDLSAILGNTRYESVTIQVGDKTVEWKR